MARTGFFGSIGFAVCALAWGPAAPAMAQDTIIVAGERIATSDVRSISREITVNSRSRQEPLARFQRPVCPGVSGLNEAVAQAVIDRMVSNAIAAGIPIDETAGCGANVWVIVVDDAQDTFERLHDDDSFLTRHLNRTEIRRIRSAQGGAIGWNLITKRNPETGQVLPEGFDAAAEFSLALTRDPPGITGSIPPPINEVSRISRLDLGIQANIELSVVLVDRAALVNLDSHALADYATMRVFARTLPPTSEGPVSSVLTLFNDVPNSDAPQRMTAFDRAYLGSLYRSSPTRPVNIALSNISSLMED